jgi:hypothetical protein
VSSLIYLLVAMTLSIVGSLILWYRHRRPRSLEYGIDEFSRELRALAPKRERGENKSG